MKHPHAELMALYAQDAMTTDKPWELWECSLLEDKWFDLQVSPVWDFDCKYRRKSVKSDLERYGVQVGDIWQQFTGYHVLILDAKTVIHEGINLSSNKGQIPIPKGTLAELLFRRGAVNKL